MFRGEAHAAGCTLVKKTQGEAQVGKQMEVWAECTGVDYQTTEFYWWLVDTYGHQTSLGGGASMSQLKNIHYNATGTWLIQMRYRTKGSSNFQDAALTVPVSPGGPAAPAPPVGFFDQITFNPASLTLQTGEKKAVTATQPTSGNPHIRWTLGQKSVVDKWTVTVGPIKQPGNYTLEAVVIDGNTGNSKPYAIPITVNAANNLQVRLQTPGGKTKLQLNEGGGKVPVVVTPQNGVPPFHLTVSVAGGGSGKRDFDRQTQFNISTTTPGNKTVTIAVADSKGSTFSRTIPFSIAAGAAPPPTNSTNPYVGSYEGTVMGPNPPNTYKYWAHVVGYDPNGTVELALYAFQDNFHVSLKGGGLTVVSGNGFKASGTGSIAGSGAVGTTITMRWPVTGSDGKTTQYTWVLKKYDDHDFGGPQPGYAR
jgi:hypothetical protein